MKQKKKYYYYIIFIKFKRRKITSQNLVKKNFDMIRAEWLRRDDNLMEVTLHQFSDNISSIY